MNPTSDSQRDLLAHLKTRIEQLETQLSRVMAQQAQQPLAKVSVPSSPSAAGAAPDAADPAIDEAQLGETAARLVRMAHNPNFTALMRGLPTQLHQVLTQLAATPMLSHEDMRQALSGLWVQAEVTVPGHFESVLGPVVRSFVAQAPSKRAMAVDSVTAYLCDQLVKFTQPTDEQLSPQLSQMQQALDDTGIAPSDIDPHTAEGQQALSYLMAGQVLRQTSALLRQQMQQAQTPAAQDSQDPQ